MDEQKRLLLAIVLSVVVLVGYQFFFVKPPDPNQQPQTTQQQEPSAPQQSATVSEYTPVPLAPAVPAAPVKKEYRTITVNTPLYEMAISEFGAAVTSMKLKAYKATNQKDSPLKQLVSENLKMGTLTMDLEGQSIPGLKEAVYSAATDSSNISLNTGETSVEFVFTSPQGVVVRKIYKFDADAYTVDCDIIFQNGSGMPVNDALVITTPGFYDDEVKKRSRFAFEGPIGLVENEYTRFKPDDIEDKSTYHGKIDWSGFTERYFMTVTMPRISADGSKEARIKLAYDDDVVSASYIQKMDRLDPGTQSLYTYTFYMGPKSQKILSHFDSSLKQAINFGFFDIIASPLLWVMNKIHDIVPNYGVAVILLTVLIKLLFWPLGTKSYKSMNEMKKVQPLMMELREKYKDDKQRMNQEIMGLYKTYKVNPASGCLPLLVQMPIFFALYRMLYQAIELRHAPFVGWITDLSAPDRLFNFDFSIPMMQAPYGIPMLTLLMGASFLLQQKMTPTGGDPMQARMMMLMPIFMTVLFINFPAGLVLYMFVNNIISMGQQYYTQKKFA
jgi:YidC/Oxa1 family membrane protein insertase